MAYLKFDQRTLSFTAECGCLESFKPNKQVKDIFKKVEELRELQDEYMSRLEYIVTKIQKINEKNHPELKTIREQQEKGEKK